MRKLSLTGALLVLCCTSHDAPGQGFGRGGRGAAAGRRGGVAAGGYRGGAAVGPWGGVAAGGARGGTFVGPRGTTVQAGRVGGVAAGPLGGVRAGGASGVRVTTPAGGTYAAGSRGGVAAGPWGGVRAGGAAWRGGPGGAAWGVRGHATRFWSPSVLNTRAAYVRRSFVRPVFNPVWFRAHPAAWVPPRWRVANYWVAPTWASLATFEGITAPPITYDFGGTTVIQNNFVFVNGEQVGTADDYAAQAVALVDRGRDATLDPNGEWQPLGVFALIQGDEDEPEHIFQLAINKAGIIRGNYYNAMVDVTAPMYGSVDARTQRAAWSGAERNGVIFETGLSNLTQEQTTVLVHRGNDQTWEMALVRLEQPAQ